VPAPATRSTSSDTVTVMSSISRVGVLTGGGDCPGLNAVIRAVTKSALNQYKLEVFGIEDGFLGLIQNRIRKMGWNDVSNILTLGGTILGTSNAANPKRYAVKRGGKTEFLDVTDRVVEHAQAAGLDALICIGGDGTMSGAADLVKHGINCIGVPKTIDNDLEATATTFGFDSAVAVVMDALDRVHTTATSHRRVMVVEVMGRHAGWIALHGGIAGGADIILIPEIPFDFDKIASVVKAREAAGYLGTVVVVAEGARPKHGEQVKRDVEGGEFRLGGIGEIVTREIAKRTGKETRCCVLGHLQRGGAPTTLDRILGTRFGVKAVQLANEGHFGSMVSYQNYQVRQVPISEAVNRLKLVPPNGEMVQTAGDVDISFGD